MTDYEINRRLAEIAGLAVTSPRIGAMQEWVSVADDRLVYHQHPWSPGEPWDPLHDWSQLGPLMEQCRIGLEYQGEWDAWAYNADDLGNEGQHCDPDLKRAIALAIIAAHEE